jgi:glyoxylase I family protein
MINHGFDIAPVCIFCPEISPFHRPNFLFNEDMNISIEHIGLPAKDSVALKAWYERVLGAKHLWDNGQHPPTCLLALGGAWVEIYPATSSRPETADNKLAGFRHLALHVASLDAAKSELEKRGVKFTGEVRPAAGGGKVLFFEDGEGNLLHFVERPKDFKLAG